MDSITHNYFPFIPFPKMKPSHYHFFLGVPFFNGVYHSIILFFSGYRFFETNSITLIFISGYRFFSNQTEMTTYHLSISHTHSVLFHIREKYIHEYILRMFPLFPMSDGALWCISCVQTLIYRS